MEEKTLWQGGPSQLVNLGLFIVCGLLCWTVIPAIMIIAAYLRTKNTIYELTNQRLRITTGTLSRRVDEIELYRVKDSTVVEPFMLRSQGLGNVVVISSDMSTPGVVLLAISNPRAVREKLRTAVESRRDQKRVRVAEME